MTTSAQEITASHYDAPHPAGDDPSWNESCYFLWSDQHSELAGFSRIGVRTNGGYVEGLHGVFLGGTRIAFAHRRRPIAEGGSGLNAGALSMICREPMQHWSVHFDGEVEDIADGKILEQPRKQRVGNWFVATRMEMTIEFTAAAPALFFEVHDSQEHLEQHGSIAGHVRIAGIECAVSGFGFRDKTWGPRTWKPTAQGFPCAAGAPSTFIKWLAAPFGPDLAFSLILKAQPDGTHRGEGLILLDGCHEAMTDIVAVSDYIVGSVLHRRVQMQGQVRGKTFRVEGEVINHIPTKIAMPEGAVLVTEGLTRWMLPDGRHTLGMAEYHVAVGKAA